jgi:hypothetical protein
MLRLIDPRTGAVLAETDEQTVLTVGSGEENALRLAVGGVGEAHASLFYDRDDETWVVRADGPGETFLGYAPAVPVFQGQARALIPGEYVQMGDALMVASA